VAEQRHSRQSEDERGYQRASGDDQDARSERSDHEGRRLSELVLGGHRTNLAIASSIVAPIRKESEPDRHRQQASILRMEAVVLKLRGPRAVSLLLHVSEGYQRPELTHLGGQERREVGVLGQNQSGALQPGAHRRQLEHLGDLIVQVLARRRGHAQAVVRLWTSESTVIS
jgi:hypothetical protein